VRFSHFIGWCFVASIFMMWRFSKYSRILIYSKKLTPEEQTRYRKKAQFALGAVAGFLALCVLCILLAIILE
jgi:hypothetical protein